MALIDFLELRQNRSMSLKNSEGLNLRFPFRLLPLGTRPQEASPASLKIHSCLQRDTVLNGMKDQSKRGN